MRSRGGNEGVIWRLSFGGSQRVVSKRVVSKKVVLADVPWTPKPERGYTERNEGTKNQNEGTKNRTAVPKTGRKKGTFAKTTLLQNRPFVSSRELRLRGGRQLISGQTSNRCLETVRESLTSVIFSPAILGPEWLHQFYGHLGLLGSFCRKTSMGIKLHELGRGFLVSFFGGGGGRCAKFILWEQGFL